MQNLIQYTIDEDIALIAGVIFRQFDIFIETYLKSNLREIHNFR